MGSRIRQIVPIRDSVLVGIGILLLVLIRMMGPTLFYDPLIAYFKGNYGYDPLPDLSIGLYMLNLALRFLLNTGISLGIIYVLFKNKDHVRFSGGIYGLTLILLLFAFAAAWPEATPENYRPVFYIRRLLIHPILLLILVPALYFKDQKESKK